jgi:hypothetical protein
LRIFKNVWFRRFARQEKIADTSLIEAVVRANQGLVDADLGGSVIKQRIAKPGKGKSGGYRTIIIFQQEERAFFVYGFAKSKRDNIEKNEEETFKKAAKELLALSDSQIVQLLEIKELTEVKQNEN